MSKDVAFVYVLTFTSSYPNKVPNTNVLSVFKSREKAQNSLEKYIKHVINYFIYSQIEKEDILITKHGKDKVEIEPKSYDEKVTLNIFKKHLVV